MSNADQNLNGTQKEKNLKEDLLDKKENVWSYYQQRCNSIGLTPERNVLRVPESPGNPNNKNFIEWSLLAEDKETGDVLIPLYNLKGEQEVFNKSGTAKRTGTTTASRTTPIEVRRYKPGNERKTKDDKFIKYDNPKGAKTLPWISPNIIEAYRTKTSVNTIIITEGYFKAISGYLNNLYIFGLAGIQNVKDKDTETLHPAILSVISELKVKNVVLLYDGDCCNISMKAVEEEKDLTKRPHGFYTSVKNLRELLKDLREELNFDLYFACVNTPGIKTNPKGLDDLFEAIPEEKNNIVKELCSFSQTKLSYFIRFNISDAINKVYEFLKLKTVEDFYTFHQESLQDSVFVFKGNSYQFNLESQKVVKQDSPEKEIETESFEKHQFFERNGEYYTIHQGKNFTKDVKISNFKMNWIYTLNNESENTPILIELIQADKSSIFLEITSENLLNLPKFSAIVLKYGLNFNGSPYIFKNIIASLQPKSKEAVYITALGQNLENDFYSFFDGVLQMNGEFIKCNEHGVVEIEDKYFYLPTGKKGNEKNSNLDDERKFKFIPGKLGLEKFIEKIYSIYGISGLIGLCYTIAAIHRDIIFTETKYFPFLFLHGGAGSGKSTYINFFMNFFGDPQPETTEQSTDKAIERKFAQIINNLQYIKEFTPSFEVSIKNILKNAYDGVGYSRALMSNNNKTQTTVVRSALAIDGNYFPTTDGALFSRLIFLPWEPNHSDKSKMETQELQDLFKTGNGLIFSDIYKQREKYKSDFSQKYRQTIIELKTLCRERKINFNERQISHLSLLAVVFKLSLREILQNDEAYNMFVDYLIKGAQKQTQITLDIDEVNKFFEALEMLYQSNLIVERTHFIREQNIGFDYLYINFNLCQVGYAKSIKETGEKFNITKEGLKQRLEFAVSKTYPYTKADEIHFPKNFNGKTIRVYVFEVEPNTFTLIKP